MTPAPGHPPGEPSYGLEMVPSRISSADKRVALARRRGADFAAHALSPESQIHGWFLPPPGVGVRGIRAVHGNRTFVARRKQLRPDLLAEHPERPDVLYSGFSITLRLDLGWNDYELQFKDSGNKWRSFCRCHLRLPWSWRIIEKFVGRAAASNYEAWTRRHGEPDAEELRGMRGFLGRFPRRPLLSVLMPVYNTPERWLARVIESVQAQIYPDWELCIADDCSSSPHVRSLLTRYAAQDPRIKVCFRATGGHICEASNSALELCTGEFTLLLDHDDEIPPHALFHVAWEVVNHPAAGVIFSDEDKVDERGVRSGPYFKPGWNYDLLLGQNCVSHLGAFRTTLLREIGGFRLGYEGSQDWDVTLRAVARGIPGGVRHIPRVLYSWRTLPSSTATTMESKPYAAAAGRRAVEDHLQSIGSRAQLLPESNGSWRILWPLPDPRPLVTLIIPTKDQVGLLSRVLEGIFSTTDYPRTEVILLDHDSQCPATVGYLNQLRQNRNDVRIMPAAGAFNWSAFSNRGAREANGEILVFLNNDVEFTSAGWLEELVRQTCRPGVGAVGPCLLFPDGTVQHAGVVLQMAGLAGHVFRHSPPEAGTIGGSPNFVREVTAVTGACLAVRRDVFERAGGFDEENLPVAYNDVDFCLKLRALGLRNLYTPFARLIHHESASRGASEATGERKAAASEEARVMLQRWPEEFAGDRLFNSNLSLKSEIPVLSTPRSRWPWQGDRTPPP